MSRSDGLVIGLRRLCSVIAGLDPAIHQLRKMLLAKRWTRGSSPRVTQSKKDPEQAKGAGDEPVRRAVVAELVPGLSPPGLGQRVARLRLELRCWGLLDLAETAGVPRFTRHEEQVWSVRCHRRISSFRRAGWRSRMFALAGPGLATCTNAAPAPWACVTTGVLSAIQATNES